jgi:hypothetical protein
VALLRTFALLILLTAFTACGQPVRNVHVALQDGTHVAGLLLAVEEDWVVIDRNATIPEPDIMLIDKAVVDTLVIPGVMSDIGRAEFAIIGAGVGAIGGYWAGEGYVPDSGRPADPKRATFAAVGAIAGVALGAGLGLVLSDVFKPGDIVFIRPEESDYDSIRTYAKYPTGLPADLREALDSGWEWKVIKN